MRNPHRALGILLLGAATACASDVWFKPGAGPDALAKDKTACSRQIETESGDPFDLFERCMEARDWWHVVPGSGDPIALRDDEVVPVEAAEGGYAPQTEGLNSESSDPGPFDVGSTDSGSGDSESADSESASAESAGAKSTTARRAGAPELPAVGSARTDSARTMAGGRPLPRRSAKRETRPIDPKRRQFWFKFGAGADTLSKDQSACRESMGLAADASSPSRWGEDPKFDACMRKRGWTGGSIESS